MITWVGAEIHSLGSEAWCSLVGDVIMVRMRPIEGHADEQYEHHSFAGRLVLVVVGEAFTQMQFEGLDDALRYRRTAWSTEVWRAAD